MLRKWVTLIFGFILMFLLATVASANADGPPISSPFQYEEIPANESLTIRWAPPPSGTVAEYRLSIRELHDGENATNTLVMNNAPFDPDETAYLWPSSSIASGGAYRISVCAVLTSGAKKWSDERYFFGAITKGININNTISFKIYTGFDYDTKEAIYYCAQRWSNQIGVEVVNTFPYNQGVTSSVLNKDDLINTVVPYTDDRTDDLMVTYYSWNNYYETITADIIVNKAFPWSNEIQSGKYYIPNVMNHEMGHVVGLADKYESFTTDWTMYGYSDPAESKKVTLHSADIAALNCLY